MKRRGNHSLEGEIETCLGELDEGREMKGGRKIEDVQETEEEEKHKEGNGGWYGKRK